MKMKKFVSILSLAFATMTTALSATAGDIMEIRAVDDPDHNMVFNKERNGSSSYLCSADRPLSVGDKLYIRVRMVVKNALEVGRFGNAPKPWSFRANGLETMALLNTPKLGLYMGEGRVPAWAEYSETGPQPWQKSGTLLTDDDGNATADYKYYTDLYFCYTVKAGDLALPLRLLNSTGTGPADATASTSDYYILNCGKTSNDYWSLVNTDNDLAEFFYIGDQDGRQETPLDWPPSTNPANKKVLNYDLTGEGVFVKTVDFDKVNAKGEAWSTGDVWREIHAKGGESDVTPQLVIAKGARAEATVVYIWSSDETKVVPYASGDQTIQTVEGRKVLKVPVPAGDDTAITFGLKSVLGAAEGDTADIYLSPIASDAKRASGDLIGVTVQRKVVIGEASDPTARIYIDAKGTYTKTVTATPDDMTCGNTRLYLNVSPACTEGDITVELQASVNGDDKLTTLDAIYDANLLRIALDGFGGDPTSDENPEVVRVKKVTIPKGQSGVYLNLYMLGATQKTDLKGITFSIKKISAPENAKVSEESNSTLYVKKSFKPVIVASTPEFAGGGSEGRIEIGSGTEVAFTLEIQDTYMNLNDTATGYTFTWKLEGEEVDPAEGIVMNEDGLFSTDYMGMNPMFYAITAGKDLTLQVTAPNGTKSEVVKYLLVVNEGRYTKITRMAEKLVFCEGEETTIKLGLTQAYGANAWIFLESDDPKQMDYVDSPLKTIGASITRGSTVNDTPRTIRFLDGTQDLSLKAVLYAGKNSSDKTRPVTTYGSGTIEFTVTNRPPSVSSVTAAGQYVTPDQNGKTLSEAISRGVKKTFSLVADDVDADKLATGKDAMSVRWIIDGETHETNTIDNADLAVTHVFKNEKDNALVQVFLKDKDMTGYPQSPNMTFYVKVKDTPRVEIWSSAVAGTFLETAKSTSTITVGLTEPASEDITVRFKVSQVKDGYLKIRTVEGSVAEATDEGGSVIPGAYDLTFSAGTLQKTLIVSEMDGTNETLGGLDLNAEVITETENAEGVAWKTYFTKAEPVLVFVQNVAPEIVRPTDVEAAYTNENASANTPYPINFGCKDVEADLAAGITVSVMIDGSEKLSTTVTDSAVHQYSAEFDGEGAHVVEVTFTDKDGMISRRSLYFYVKPSKRLQLRAHGPASSLGTSGGYSQHYGLAAGLGAGRVYAGSTGPQKVLNFVHTYSFAETETSIGAYAFGYKADGADDNGAMIPGPDKGIDANGSWSKGDNITSFYNYTKQHKYGKLGYDSFLYGWACNNTESTDGKKSNSDGSSESTTQSFLLNIGEKGEMNIPLPASDNNDKGDNAQVKAYPMQYWEAVFSREFLKSDNCGDINQDGVPDVAVYRFGMGVVDTSTYKLVESSETNTEGDLTDLKDYNGDVDRYGNENPDYLPSDDVAAYYQLIPGLKESWSASGLEFGARLEIRGYHDGLNDALEQLGIDVTPDRIYAVSKEVEGETVWSWDETCTISELEFAAWTEYAAANGLTWNNPDDWKKWSPERPTNPAKSDTDGDGFDDGYEYYFWYRAHVGYWDVDAKGNRVHKYLTGRKYDVRNPGEGVLITSEEIEKLMDPQTRYAGSDALTRDSDNDGLPDVLEFEIGTNPFDFDTDGDGLADGWEIMIAGLNPLTEQTCADGKVDTERNYDGDAMAISSWKLEKTWKPAAMDVDHAKFTTFAVIAANGDTDGVQWYAVKGEPELSVKTNKAWGVTLADGSEYVICEKDKPTLSYAGTLARTYGRDVTFAAKPEKVITKKEVENPEAPGEMITVEETNLVYACGYPVRLAAGSAVKSISEKQCDYVVSSVAKEIKPEAANACWIYGRGSVNNLIGQVAETAADYGCLALGRQLGVQKGAVICAMPSDERDVAFLHYLCYQEFGFDPRAAWKAKDPLATRWSKTVGGEAVEGITVVRQGGYTGSPARTRDYAAYDEFLVYSFFVNNGCDMTGFTYVISAEAPSLAKSWGAYTTNPQGPNEPEATALDLGGEGESKNYYFGRDSVNGADTDGDGVPDGWELYVMSGPKKDGAFVFANPYAGFVVSDGEKMPASFFSPFVDAAKKTDTSNQIYLGGQINDDGLNEFQEFEGTDTMNYYAEYSTTVVHEGTWKWFNKFFPTDPWNADTDGDGLNDKDEGSNFVYGTPADDGKLWSIPGGGLNPCSVDTDRDGLPDAWEAQFKGRTQYAGTLGNKAKDDTGAEIGNYLQGLVDGMDGTVADAFSYPVSNSKGNSTNTLTYVVVDGVNQVVNRDYDHDGLENWQEYLTGTMRCWRYDDPLSPWTSIPDEMYWDTDEKGEKTWNPKFAELGVADRDEFWYKTLVDKTSPIYNPFLVTGTSSGAQYFSRVTNAWDCAFIDSTLVSKRGAAYYWFAKRIGGSMIKDLWAPPNGPLPLQNGWLAEPNRYACCSPIDADSDHDGMDDYYELFHGMNPLLGKSGVMHYDEGPCDLIFDAWANGDHKGLEAWGTGDSMNFWQRNPPATPDGNGYDFKVFPWLNGMADADPDGDTIPNQEESLMPTMSKFALHTDPTPLWMTDSSYGESLVRRFFRMPTRFEEVDPGNTKFTYQGETYKFCTFDGWVPEAGMTPAHFGRFTPDAWQAAANGAANWICSFEENEGYDTDHDGISDMEEKKGDFRLQASDSQDADSPRRRQAMYFQGADAPSALQTMPFVHETYPMKGGYPDDLAFVQFTAECWVKPESLDNSVILERAVWTGESSPADAEYMRKNFQMGITGSTDGAYWYAKFDPIGTASDTAQVKVLSRTKATTAKWTHLAVSYNGTDLILYVDGYPEQTKQSGLVPSWGASAVAVTTAQQYWFDREHDLRAIIIGASAKTQAEGVADGSALDVTRGCGWDRYTGFYKGWIDEVRIWDGARTAKQIGDEMKTRYTAEMAAQNRTSFYDEWKSGKRRYEKDGSGKDVSMMAELRFHWSFDSLFGADSAEAVARIPHGFDSVRAQMSRPADYAIGWWKAVLDGYAGTVYCDPAWVSWIPNTVTHLPRFDGTTLDSVYWSKDFRGDVSGSYGFAQTAEPVSFWTQMARSGVPLASEGTSYLTTSSRHFLANEMSWRSGSSFGAIFDFAGRNLNQTGDDLLPLGGVYARYCDMEVGLWDEQGPSTNWEITGNDSDGDGLPDWWEQYADENYRGDLDPSADITWDSLISYRGNAVKAGEAYLRDIARGAFMNEYGEIADEKDWGKYRQIADEDMSGVPDWWEDYYGVRGENGLDDHDNDGLPNYVEYLLSEVFDFKGIVFDPTVACSVDQNTPDYFYRVGELYVGEIFTDHDLVDDAWEDLYEKTFASRLAYDAFADNDEDGWCNRSENRYAKQAMPTISNQQTHYTAADGLVADYPIPTLALTLRYNGNRQDTVRMAPIGIQVTTDTNYTRTADATYLIGAVAEEKASSGTEEGKSTTTRATETRHTRTLGKWSNRHALGTLTPGNIKVNSIDLEYCYDPSSITYSWEVRRINPKGLYFEWVAKRGTKSEHDADCRNYGEENVKFLSASSDYRHLDGLELRSDENSSVATWIHTQSGLTLGTINLVTGEFDLDLGVFKGYYSVNATNAADYVSLEDQTYRVVYTANPSIGLPRKLYLGEADVGHVREGKNTVIAWADLNGNGIWEVGEPYGMVRDVDVSWKGTAAEIELTDTSAITPRIDLTTDTADGRGKTRAEVIAEIGAHPDLNKQTILEKLGNEQIVDTVAEAGSFKEQRVRVVRWLVNDVPMYLNGAVPRVVLDKRIETDVRTSLTEADLLIGNQAFDLDWDNLYSEVITKSSVIQSCGNVRSVKYLVVIGDGDIAWETFGGSNTVVNALQTVITRKFGSTWVKPAPVAPGAVSEEIVSSANPTFKWTMDCPDDEAYTAFKIQVSDTSGALVYDSGIQAAPPKAGDTYVWEAPLYVGDKTLTGKVFENKRVYTWKVSMYNAKFSSGDNFGAAGRFRMEVQENGYSYGTANVAVRYFGPSASHAGKTIRVRAYTSPDFTGKPVAGGYVADNASMALVGQKPEANCRIVGIPRGTYYLLAFIDSNNNDACDPWETSGYFCMRDGSTPDYLDPTPITFDSEIGRSDLAVIYLEDADTDGDDLPDAWEYATYGSLTAKGVETLAETPAGELTVNASLSGALKVQENALVPTAGLASRVRRLLSASTPMAALTMGLDPSSVEMGENGELLVKPIVKDGTLVISKFAFDAASRAASFKVSAAVEQSADVPESSIYQVEVLAGTTVGVKVLHSNAPVGPWTQVGETKQVKIGGEDGLEAGDIVIGMPEVEANAGYFKVVIEE